MSAPLSEIAEHLRTYVEHVKQAQKAFETWLKQKKRLSDSERQCFEQRSIADATAYWTAVSHESQAAFDAKHETGWRYWAKSAQTIAVAAGRFMKDFKPLVDFAASSGPYGGLAVGAISGLFAIARAKSKTDDVIAVAMAGILDRLPSFRMLEEIYNDSDAHQKRLRRKVAMAYSGITEFAIAAAKYYLQPGFKRWWQATWDSEHFSGLADHCQGFIVAVRLQSEDLVTVVVNDIRARSVALQKQNEKLEADLAQLQEDSDNSKLVTLQGLLGLSSWTPEAQQNRIEEYRQALERAHRDCRIFEWMDEAAIEKYKRCQAIRDWEASSVSSVLLIVCVNHGRLPRKDHCWLSPLALNLVHSDQSSQKALAHYVFDYEVRTSIHAVMPDVLLQLLRLQKHSDLSALAPKLEKYRSSFDGEGRVRNETKAKEALTDAALTIARLLDPQKEVHIILDRIDRCVEEDQLDFMTLLNRISEETKCCLKVLAVASKSYWEVEGYEEERLTECLKFKQITETQNMLLRKRIDHVSDPSNTSLD